MGRFSHRPTRLKRQQESKIFASFLMPLAWICGVIGLASLATVFLARAISNDWSYRAFSAALGLMFIPLLMLALRFARGHYSHDLKEP
jgi:uncharacterized membrane protein (DUF485 family)